ncbi:hypothetical protein DE146DRAFT_151338 [Phaeosphaeria sp. MPI-PUGE-AT-0046c]|nr:hypothetical protein DE146DRAFT_151338 [Phaeosphaeria sp. MPI-PUGE-AT-0046c]
MRRQATCNLLATLSYPPWPKSLDREVYMTPGGEERVPFHVHVRRSHISTVPLQYSGALSAFCQLPEELQSYILDLCSDSSLFQLMHTSSKLRIEASKVFWGRKNVYFSVEAQWLLNNAYPGYSYWDTAFLANVQTVQVEYEPTISWKICRKRGETREVQHALLDRFWASLHYRFPNARTVIINHDEEGTSWADEKEPFPLALQLLLRACPKGITSFVLFLEKMALCMADTADWRTAAWQRCLFQQTETGGWHKSESDSIRKIVLMPPRQFNGPVGLFRGIGYQSYYTIRLQHFGLWVLMVEALDRYYFDMGRKTSFACPFSSCTADFYQGGEWTVHAANTHYQEWEGLLEILPNTREAAQLRIRSDALDQKKLDVQAQFREIRDAWTLGDKVTQREIKRSWVEQLNRDPSWDTEERGEKNGLWQEFIEALHPSY